MEYPIETNIGKEYQIEMNRSYRNNGPAWANIPARNPNPENQQNELRDYGPEPFVVDIEEATLKNTNFRTALWTGEYLQLTLMSIDVGGEVGLELHPDVDQFIRVEQGEGMTLMGDSRDDLYYRRGVSDDDVLLIPAGKWHNLINTGNTPLKLYSIYAPPEHPRGTVHVTSADGEHH